MEEPTQSIKQQTQKAQQMYDDGRRKLQEIAQSASEKSKEMISFTDSWVHENPWTTLAIVAGAGIIIGLVAGKCSRRSE